MATIKGFQLETDGDVVLRMSQNDYNYILFALGYYTGGLMKDKNVAGADNVIDLMNRINKGNPNYVPYSTKKRRSK